MTKTIYRVRLRNRGQITVPPEIRSLLGASEGDDLVFYTDQSGRVIISRAQMIDPEQAWFWSEHWQRMERQANEDIAADRLAAFDDVSDVINRLDDLASDFDAED